MDITAIKSTGRAIRRRLYQAPYRGYGPMPLGAKQAALKRVFTPGAVVIETGTYHGDSSRFFAGAGHPVHTIEVSETLAAQVFTGLRRIGVTCHRGDSARILPELLATLRDEGVEELNFWLDGHWSGGVTSTAPTHETPIIAELVAIEQLRRHFRRLVGRGRRHALLRQRRGLSGQVLPHRLGAQECPAVVFSSRYFRGVDGAIRRSLAKDCSEL